MFTFGGRGHVFFFLLIVFYMCSESYFGRSLSDFYKYHQMAKLFTYNMKMKKELGTEISGKLRCFLT